MKKIAIILALLLAACSKPEAETIYNEIYINPEYDDELEIIGISKQLFDGKGGNAEFIVKSNLEYNLRADQNWVILVGSRASTLPHNKAVAFAVKPYEIGYADKNRTATITVETTDGSISRSFSIEQSPAETYHIALLSINPDPVTSLGGEVVVKAVIDRAGKVLSATVSSGGDECMRQTAISAAKSSRFDHNSDAPAKQEGTITYIFIPQ
jgi:hypothetical protein